MKFDNNSNGMSESVIPSFSIKEQYLAEYFDLVALFRSCSGMRLKGVPLPTIENSKLYRVWLINIISMGEKLRRKMEDKSKSGKDYKTLLNSLKKLYEGEILAFQEAVDCTKKITDFFEDAGYTKLDIPRIPPGEAAREWQ